MSQPIHIALVEDDKGLRETLGQIFSTAPGFRVVASCPDGESALRDLPAVSPHVVLMDINLPGISGIECLQKLKALLPSVRVVMVTVYEDSDTLFESLAAGADGYLLKRATRLRLLDAVREIAAGGAPISPQMARRMVEYFHQAKHQGRTRRPDLASAGTELSELTAREQEVLRLLAQGMVPKEVAAELGISWDTVRNHTSNIYQKLHVHSRTEAILKYLGRGTGRP